MTKLESLKETIINVINQRGLKQCAVYQHNNNNVMFNVTGERQIRYEEIFNQFSGKNENRRILNGLELEINETYRNNGTNENISFYIYIMKWTNNNGRVQERVKVSSRDSLKKQVRLVNEIVDKYLELTKEVK